MNWDKAGFFISVITLLITIVIFMYQQKILKKNEQILRRDYLQFKNRYD